MSQQASHNEIMEGVKSLSDRVDVIEAHGPSIIAEMADLKELIMDMRQDASETLRQLADVQEEIAETKGIVEAWAAVRTFGKFITWFGGVVVAITAIVASFKFGWLASDTADLVKH